TRLAARRSSGRERRGAGRLVARGDASLVRGVVGRAPPWCGRRAMGPGGAMASRARQRRSRLARASAPPLAGAPAGRVVHARRARTPATRERRHAREPHPRQRRGAPARGRPEHPRRPGPGRVATARRRAARAAHAGRDARRALRDGGARDARGLGSPAPRRRAHGGAGVKPVMIVVLVDALGWTLAGRDPAFAPALRERRPLATVLGFSSGALPTAFTGRPASEHGRWLMYARAGERGTFRGFDALRWLPA